MSRKSRFIVVWIAFFVELRNKTKQFYFFCLLRPQISSPYYQRFKLVYLNLNLDVIPKYTPEIQVKDAFRHLLARLSSIDSLDQSIVDNEEDQPLFCDGAGDEEVVELDT